MTVAVDTSRPLQYDIVCADNRMPVEGAFGNSTHSSQCLYQPLVHCPCSIFLTFKVINDLAHAAKRAAQEQQNVCCVRITGRKDLRPVELQHLQQAA